MNDEFKARTKHVRTLFRIILL